VRIFGTDQQGHIFSEKVDTVDVSQNGVRLTGVRAQLNADEIIGLTCGRNKIHFRVKWLGAQGTPAEGQVGLLNLTPERPLWDQQLPHGIIDNFRNELRSERRKAPRVPCTIPVELKPMGEAPMWGKASDISIGGCFVEMPVPLKADAKLEIALWLGGTKLRLQGEVASSAPGYGVGIRFVNLSAPDQEFLAMHIQSIGQEV
jgi:hypothetical protein